MDYSTLQCVTRIYFKCVIEGTAGTTLGRSCIWKCVVNTQGTNFLLKYKAHNIRLQKSQFYFVLGICVQNNFNKSSKEYLMRFYIICQYLSKLCRYFSPPHFISIEKSNEIRLLCFLFKKLFLVDFHPAKLHPLYWVCRCCMDMADAICIQTSIGQNAHRFLPLHTFTHHFIIDCNWINQMATAKFTFVIYSRWQNLKCPHAVIFVEILISAVELVLKAGLLRII